MRLHERFNRSGFSHFINSPAGRAFRLIAGVGFLTVGLIYRHHALGIASIVWSVLPLTAGAFDWCYVSAALRGPLRGAVIRAWAAVARGGSSRAA